MPAGPEPMTAASPTAPDLLLERDRRIDALVEHRLEDLVAGVAVRVADGDRLVDLVAPAVLLARRRADAPEHADGNGMVRLKMRVLSRQFASALALRKPGMSMWLGHLFWHGGRQYALWSLKISSRLVRRSRRTSSVWVWTFISGSHDARARDRRMLLALDLDDAHPAGAEAGQLGLVAQGRDLDPVVAADLEDGLALEALDDPAVDLDADARRRLRALRRLRVEQALGQRIRASVRRVGGGNGRRPSGRARVSVMRGASMARPARAGVARSNSEPKYRIPLVSGRVARRSWSHSAEATMSAARSRPARRRSGRLRPSSRRSTISARRFVPIRHGIVLPHASDEQKRVSTPTSSTRSVRSSTATTEPEPTWAPAVAQRRRTCTACPARRAGAARRTGRRRGRPCSERPSGSAAPSARTSRSGVPSGTSAMPWPPGVRTWTRIVPGAWSVPVAAEGVGALAQDPRHGGQGLDVVDDGRHAVQAARGGMRRPLLGLAALALEGLEQDGLLAEHVGALDRPDLEPQVVARSHGRSRRGGRPSVASADGRLERRR